MKAPHLTQSFGVTERPIQDQKSRLYFKLHDEAPRIAMAIYIQGGNRIEPFPGAADMVDDLLCEGTEKRTAEQIAIEIDSLSLDMETDTRRDYSIMTATFLEEDLDASLEFMADMLFHSTLKDFEKEKVRLHGELTMDLDSPRNQSHDLLMTRLFQNTPYQASHSNILQALPGVTSPQPLHQHYQQVYQPENIFFSVVGNIDIDTIQPRIEQFFQRGTGQNWQDHNPPQSVALPETVIVRQAKAESSQLHVYKGWFAPQANHPDYPAMVVLNTILGGAGLTSRLFLELRDKQGLAYAVRSQYEASRYLGIFHLYIGTDPKNRDKVLRGFEIECQKLMDHPVSHQELEEAKENVLGRRVVFLETAAQQCQYIGNQIALGVSLDELENLPQRIQEVTAHQVQAAAQQYLSAPAVISMVGPSAYL